MKIAVNPVVLEWAVMRSGHEANLLERCPRLSEWLSGADQPTLHQLEAFAKAASVPFGYLLLPEVPKEQLPIPHFRTLGDEPVRQSSPDLLETVHTMQRRQAWMREYLVEQGSEPLPAVRSVTVDDNSAIIARRMRETLGFDEAWATREPTWTDALRTLQRQIEEAGILVVVNGVVGNNTHRKLDPTEFRGFVLVDEYAPLLFVNGADGKAAQMFTLSHELAHVFFGSSAAFDLRELQPAGDQTEQACNRVAAEFLVAAGQLYDLWPFVRNDPERFRTVARKFKVSEVVAARRALDLGLITRDVFFEFYRAWQERDLPMHFGSEGGNFYATQNLRIGRRFGEAVVQATSEGRLLYREAYRLTGLSGHTFQSYAAIAFGALV